MGGIRAALHQWAERVHISPPGDELARVTGSRLAPEVAGVDQIQRRVHFTEPAGGHVQAKRRSH